jgi:MFS family permease
VNRNFRLLFASRAISYVGTYLAPIAVAFAVLDLHGSATAVGLSFAAWTLAQVSMLALGGVLGDRFPRRTVMIASDVASTTVRATMGVLLVTGNAEVWELIVLQAFGGAAVAFYNPSFYGLVREIVPEESLQRANSYLAIARYAAFPLGAATGGAIVATVGPGTALLFDAATYAASALLLSFVRVKSIARASASFLRELRDGWSAFVEHQWVWVTCLWISLYFVFTYAPFFVLGPYISDHSMNGAGTWGAVVTGEGVGALLGSISGLRLHAARPLLVVSYVFMPTAIQSVLLAFHAPVYALVPAAACAGFGFACGSVIWDTAMQRTIAPEKLARVGAYGWMSAMVFLPAGYALAGPISSVVGMHAYLLFGAIWLVASTLFICRLPSIRDFSYAEEAEPAAAPA